MMMKEDWNDLSTFHVGSVLSVAWQILFKEPGICIGLTFVSFLITGIVGTSIRVIVVDVSPVTRLIYILILLAVSLVEQGAIAYAVFQVIMGGRASVGESVLRSASKVFALLAVAILSTLGVVLVGILFLVPSVILKCMWYVSAPLCVVERLGPIESLCRSRALAKGYRWQVFGVAVLSYTTVGLIDILFRLLARVFVSDVFFKNTVIKIVTGLAMLIPNTFANVAATVTYYRLRVVKEGLSVESLANVFD
jgi:hypothetical protein